MSRLDGSSTYWHFLGGLAVFGFGMALTSTPSTTAIVTSLPRAKQGVASAMNDVSRELGSALGIAVLGSLFSSGYRDAISGATAALPPEAAHAVGESAGAGLAVASKCRPIGRRSGQCGPGRVRRGPWRCDVCRSVDRDRRGGLRRLEGPGSEHLDRGRSRTRRRRRSGVSWSHEPADQRRLTAGVGTIATCRSACSDRSLSQARWEVPWSSGQQAAGADRDPRPRSREHCAHAAAHRRTLGRPASAGPERLAGAGVEDPPAACGGWRSGTHRDPPVGYQLDVGRDEIDALRFEALLVDAAAASASGDFAAAAALLRTALDLWSGTALVDAPDTEIFASIRTRFEELHRTAVEDLVDAELALGHHDRLAPHLEAHVAAEPLRERRWGQMMRALYGAGQQAGALRAYQRARDTLIDELGVEPSAELRRLEAAVLAQDESRARTSADGVAQRADRRRLSPSRQPSPPGRRMHRTGT